MLTHRNFIDEVYGIITLDEVNVVWSIILKHKEESRKRIK
jgi:hypothetical protein